MEGPVPAGTVSRQPLCRSHVWQVEGGGNWGLGSAGNSPGLINHVTLLQGLACFRQGTLNISSVLSIVCLVLERQIGIRQSLLSKGSESGEWYWRLEPYHSSATYHFYELVKPLGFAKTLFAHLQNGFTYLMKLWWESVHRQPGTRT